MPSNLVSPNGRPLAFQKQVTVSHDQMMAVANRLIDAQLATLLNFGIPPIQVIEMLTNHVSNLLARFDPPPAREDLTRRVIDALRKDVIDKARRRSLDEAAPTRPNGPTR